MSILDGIQPGNRTVKVNGVAAAKSRDTLEFVGPGLTIADLGDRTTVSIPSDTLKGLSPTEFQIPAFENGNWRTINGRPPLSKTLITVPSGAGVVIQDQIFTVSGSAVDAVQIERVLVRILNPLSTHEGDLTHISIGFAPTDAGIIVSSVVPVGVTGIAFGKSISDFGSSWAGGNLLGVSGGDAIWVQILATTAVINPTPQIEVSLWGFVL